MGTLTNRGFTQLNFENWELLQKKSSFVAQNRSFAAIIKI
ncbi:hypothetical protein LEP1GSC021_1082 [Leptospira noguchii str. 1993005606]|uniref:Uncharacterized protein n=2 Tax=Leptospira noguchii TaxID=28182 RepID=M6YLQ5_9LEPT|nr:hypothetical protein LEP1GSC035_4510 [Leptospira noguchii str. 2007001578]EMO88040.1 hypothetical protein LEP1GSC024_2203 [Leptospira noguchii str. 2001034031]EMO90509.1 hypothetical protein LEP1GSC024_1128 [Leptospira noguchii str. 2001034031]EPE81765.1 hypothetical protein LEP1GSC021_1082 [Leptospira noguchii str. 1993005606]